MGVGEGHKRSSLNKTQKTSAGYQENRETAEAKGEEHSKEEGKSGTADVL